MSDLGTIRERIERATGYFARREGIVLTTFNLHGQFLEEQALPAILGVEAVTGAARNAGLHRQLAETDCTVFYDPTVPPGVSGKFRYVARPVPLRGRLFHPKLVIIAGRSEDGTTWVYLAVSSANLTLSGWGRNAESFGETWIHTRTQQAWHGLDQLLAWLKDYAKLGEEPDHRDAVAVVRAALDRMPDGYRFRNDDSKPWFDTLYAHFYSSVVDKEGLPSFLKMGRSRRPAELWVYSPYWGSVAKMVDEFGAKRTVLVPAMRADRKAIGMSKSQHDAITGIAEVRRNESEKQDDRFWHMKAYWIRHGGGTYTAVGSCNFTEAGLAGANGNVEAMLVFEHIEPDDWPEESDTARPEDLSEQPVDEEEAPDPIPVVIVVAYDWWSRSWRWFLDAGDSQDDFHLSLPTGLAAFRIVPGSGERRGDAPDLPAHYKVTYTQHSERREWRGQVVELHLDHTRRTYGKPLSASDILESWRVHVKTGGPGPGGGGGDGDEDDDDTQAEVPAAFDAVNLYDLYRAMRAVRTRLGELESEPQAQRALLVGRSDSVMALARLAEGDGEAPVVRYLVLRELSSIVKDCKGPSLYGGPLRRVHKMKRRAKATTLKQLASELRGDREKARKMLDWFERRLAKMDRTGT
jgi:hypothetical protein